MLMLFCHPELSTGLVYSSPRLSEDIDGSDNLVAIYGQLFAVMLNFEKNIIFVETCASTHLWLAISLDLFINLC